MNDENLQRAFFIALVVGVTVAFLWLINGFFQPIFWAIALGIVFFPAHVFIEKKVPRRSIAAALSVLLIITVVILPVVFVALAVTTEAASLYQELSEGEVSFQDIYTQITQWLPQISNRFPALDFDMQAVQDQIQESAVSMSQLIAQQALQVGQNTLRVALYFFIMLYLLFFSLRDGRHMLDRLVAALPLGDERERHLLERFAEVSRATIKGTLVVGIVQGTIGGIAFAALGIRAPVMWGTVMALLSIVPAVGPALVWIPAAIILAAMGDIWQAIVLVVVGTLVIGLVDNLLRPILVGRDTKMPDYLILLSTLGGLTAFGLAGIVIGPIIAAFFLSVWQMAEDEFAGAHAHANAKSRTKPDPDRQPTPPVRS